MIERGKGINWEIGIDLTDWCSVTQSCLIFCDPMDCGIPGLPVLDYLLEFAQTHAHWVSDAIKPSYPLLSPSPPALNLSQHQDLFQWMLFFASDGQSTAASTSESLLLMHIQGWFPLGLTGLISLLSKELSRVLTSITVQKHSFFDVQLSLWSNPHICDYWKHHCFD